MLSLDDYYRDLSHLKPALREARNFDHPDALDWDRLFSDLDDLARGYSVQAPLYDFAGHLRRGSRTIEAPQRVLIVEGMFVLQRARLRATLDLSIFIDLPRETCLQRRLARDTQERARSPRSVREQFVSTVEPMYREHVLPTKTHADLVVDGRRPLAEAEEIVAEAAGEF